MVKSLILMTFLLASFSSFPAATESFSPLTLASMPTPTPANSKTAKKDVVVTSGPISSQAAAAGVSLPVRDLPAAVPDGDPTPREINPQNSIRIKPQSDATVPTATATNTSPRKKTTRRHKFKR